MIRDDKKYNFTKVRNIVDMEWLWVLDDHHIIASCAFVRELPLSFRAAICCVMSYRINQKIGSSVESKKVVMSTEDFFLYIK